MTPWLVAGAWIRRRGNMKTGSLSSTHGPPILTNLLVFHKHFQFFSFHQSSLAFAAKKTKKLFAIQNEWKGIKGG
jgi:hypothetical protein